jgi:O-antigen/teichoic acid export membrane protein
MQMRHGHNAAWAVAEVVVSGLVMFVLYRVIVAKLSVEILGIWSLVLATTSLSRFADLGAAAGLVRFVAIPKDRGNASEILGIVETAIFSNLVFYAFMSLVLYWPAFYGLSYAIHGTSLVMARGLLPFALTAFVLMNVSSVFYAALVGQHRADQKSMVTVAGLMVQAAMAILLVGTYGLIGLAWAQIAQNLFTIGLGWLVFLRNLAGHWHLRMPSHWNISAFRTLVGFGMRLQASNIMLLLSEPLMKFVMSSLGGLDALGYYEMASRLILLIRQLIVMPAQILAPAFAANEGNESVLRNLYAKASAVTLVVGLPMMTCLAVGSPLVSYLWLGHVDDLFLFFVIVSSAGWAANILVVPAHFLGIGTGRLGWNILGSSIIGLGGPMLGVALGSLFGARGVALAAAGMLAIGSLVSLMNCRERGIAPLDMAGSLKALKASTLLRSSLTALFGFFLAFFRR